MQYGSETLHVPYLPITGRVSLDVETTNNVFWGSIGPQIQVPVGPVQPYMNAAIGFMDLVPALQFADPTVSTNMRSAPTIPTMRRPPGSLAEDSTFRLERARRSSSMLAAILLRRRGYVSHRGWHRRQPRRVGYAAAASQQDGSQ